MTTAVLLLALLLDERLIFTKSFPKSDPPYVGITVQQSGAAEFRSDPKDEQPVLFQMTPAETSTLFALADKVNLNMKLESPLKVAFMGTKTIRIEKDGKAVEQTFNYTEDADARALADWFERISESERCFLDLERTAKYEKIGVNEAILGLQSSWERKRLVAPKQFLPLLDKVAKSDSYVQMARTRAANLADSFRSLP
jgi:hypothetical protein